MQAFAAASVPSYVVSLRPAAPAVASFPALAALDALTDATSLAAHYLLVRYEQAAAERSPADSADSAADAAGFALRVKRFVAEQDALALPKQSHLFLAHSASVAVVVGC
jgi:hypothetical protein